jgi:hypothetical protein
MAMHIADPAFPAASAYLDHYLESMIIVNVKNARKRPVSCHAFAVHGFAFGILNLP